MIAACLIAALASLLRGGRYVHELHGPRAAQAPAPAEVAAGVWQTPALRRAESTRSP